MRSFRFSIIACCCVCGLSACTPEVSSNLEKEPALNITIQNYPHAPLYLAQLYGDAPLVVDTLLTNAQGQAHFAFPHKRPPGMYRIYVGHQQLQFIYDREEVVLHTHIDDLNQYLKVEASTQNQHYQEFSKLEALNRRKQSAMKTLMSAYLPEESMYQTARKEYGRLEAELASFVDKLEKEQPTAFLSRYLRFVYPPSLPAEWAEEQSRRYLQVHLLDQCDFQDTLLHYSPAYHTKLLDYLKLYRQAGLNRQQQAAAFIRASSQIMDKAKVNPYSYLFTLEFLLNGFEQLQMKEVLSWLADTYDLQLAAESCEKEGQVEKLQQKIDHHRQIAIGKPAPEVEVVDMKGTPVRLSTLPSPYRLLLFWSSKCPHCQELLPQIKEIYTQLPDNQLEIIAISLDIQDQSWRNFVETGQYNWINSCDLMGWEGTAARAYHVYATPVMVLINQDGIIVGKPGNAEELASLLK